MNLTPAQTEYLLSGLRTLDSPYPLELQAARRASFVAQIRAQADEHEWQAPSIKDQLDSAGYGHSGQF
jgi:predicted DNA-binding transcriptional regulator YafY